MAKPAKHLITSIEDMFVSGDPEEGTSWISA
jgi:hypothetical protein